MISGDFYRCPHYKTFKGLTEVFYFERPYPKGHFYFPISLLFFCLILLIFQDWKPSVISDTLLLHLRVFKIENFGLLAIWFSSYFPLHSFSIFYLQFSFSISHSFFIIFLLPSTIFVDFINFVWSMTWRVVCFWPTDFSLLRLYFF